MKKSWQIMLVLAIAVSLIFLLGRWTHFGSQTAETRAGAAAEVRYQCPMHPHIIQPKPGKCPICHMELQLMKSDTKSADSNGGAKKVLYYRHPMTPSIHSPVPAKDEMGMPFIPVYEEADAASGIKGRATVVVGLDKQQRIGVVTEQAERRRILKTIYAAGRVAYDPELYRAQTDFIGASRAYEKSQTSPIEGAQKRSEELLSSLRLRLRILGMTDDEIEALRDAGKADKNLLLADAAPGEVWLYADVYEGEIPLVKIGQKISASIPSGETFEGEIRSVDPIIDPVTRTAKIRAKLPDPKGLLRPGMYLNVLIQLDLGERLAAPRQAVLDTGKRKILYVSEEDGRFVPREVRTGISGGEYVSVEEGLAPGERVVVSGNFLIDAESQLAGSASIQSHGPGEANDQGKELER